MIMIALTLAACSARPTDDGGELPTDLSELKSLRDQVEADLRDSETRLEEIKEKIEELEPQRKKQARLVTTQEIVTGEFRKYAKIQGSVESRDLVSVSAEVPGRLTSVKVEEGHPVKRGQLIATLDLESIAKQKEEVETSLELARDIYERQSRLWEQNIGSEVQYLQAKNNVERLEQSLETLDHQMSKANVYAPLTGVVDMVNLKTGEMAQPGAPIIMILNTRNLKVVADVPESYLGNVDEGDKVHIYFPALDREDILPVTLIGRKIDPSNRTFKVEMNIAAANGLIKPNLLAEVQINNYVEQDVIIISQELVQQEVGGKRYVMVVNDGAGEPVSKKVYITTGESYEGDVVVTKGLAVGDEIVVSGSRGLPDGERIQIVNPEIAADGE